MENIKKLSALTCITLNKEEHEILSNDVQSIMNYVKQLQSCETDGIAPLFHPFDLQQHLREDKVTEKDCSAKLAQLAPQFDDKLYRVPKVIKNGD